MKRKESKNKKQANKSYNKVTVLTVIGIVLLVVPVAVLIAANLLLAAPSSAWAIIGYIGAFIMGIGLFNGIMSIGRTSLGTKFTLICVLLGIALVAISEALVFNSHLFSENLVSYYFISMLFIVATLINYWMFRGGVYSYLRNKGLSKTSINKNQKGKRNFLWYENIHKEFNLGKWYYINKIYTILFILAFSVNLVLGFFKITSVLTCCLSVSLYILSAVMGLFGSIQGNIEEHGKAFVLFAKTKSGKIDSSFYDLFFLLFPAGMAYAQLILTVGLWK